MITRVVFICYYPLSEKFVGDYYLNELAGAGIDVEYWDCSEMFFGDKRFENEIERGYVNYVKNMKDFRDLLKYCNKNALIVPQIDIDPKCASFFRVLSRSKHILGFFRRPGLPLDQFAPSVRPGTVLRILGLSTHPFRTCGKVKYRVQKHLIRPFDVEFVAGLMAVSNSRVKNKVFVNHFDYDAYLSAKRGNARPILGGKYAIFLDDGFLDSPDMRTHGGVTLSSEYIRSLIDYFKKVEEAGYEVLVAAHPHSNYPQGTWGIHRVIRGETRSLVQGCSLVLAHASTALSFAVLYKKPVTLMINKQIREAYPDTIVRWIWALSKVLGCNVTDIDEKWIDPSTRFDERAYEQYSLKYLTSVASRDSITPEIFIKWLKEHE